jgi:GT2 family glycosyltransferase
MTDLTVGFVVIGRNEGSRLEHCLRSVLSISRHVVYADSASEDGSVDLARKLGVSVVVLPADGQLSAARGRNEGYAELKKRFPGFEAVQFLDGDCILQPGWIEKAVAFLIEHPDVAVVCGRRFEAHPNASIYNALCDAEWNTPVGEASECGGDALVRTKAFDEVGGYRTSLRAGEEPEMTARMRAAGWRIWRIDAPMTEHDARILSFRQWWRRTQRGGYGYAQAWQATKGLPQRLYARNLRSALVWAVAMPLLMMSIAFTTRSFSALVLLPVLYLLQLIRIAAKSERSGRIRWIRAEMLFLAKFPEALGAIRYFTAGKSHALPEYKSHA